MSDVSSTDSPKREDEREDENPGDRPTFTNFVVAVRVVLRKYHQQDHVDNECARSIGQRKFSSHFVDITQADSVGYEAHHTCRSISVSFFATTKPKLTVGSRDPEDSPSSDTNTLEQVGLVVVDHVHTSRLEEDL